MQILKHMSLTCTWSNSAHWWCLPGDVVRRASRDAGFNGVGAIHTHCVKGLVTVPKGIEVDVGLRSCSGPGLTWKHTHTEKANIFSSDKHYLFFLCTHAHLCGTCLCHSIRDNSLPRWYRCWITKPRHCETLLYFQWKINPQMWLVLLKKRCPNNRARKQTNKKKGLQNES